MGFGTTKGLLPYLLPAVRKIKVLTINYNVN